MIAVDWSGASGSHRRHLWVAVTDGHGAVVDLRPYTREEAAARILDVAGRSPDLVVGLDFSFSLPEWWLTACGIASAPELWGDAERLEGWLAACDPPFWGRPGRRRPPGPLEAGYRRTELAVSPRPRSTFQVRGAGSVGTASLRGMPVLARLRDAGMTIWPFERWRTPAVVEVWPRLAIGPLVKSDPAARRGWVGSHRRMLASVVADAAAGSPDALDAAAAALDLAARCGCRPDPDDRVVGLEGWIDGVPIPPGRTATGLPGGPGPARPTSDRPGRGR